MLVEELCKVCGIPEAEDLTGWPDLTVFFFYSLRFLHIFSMIFIFLHTLSKEVWKSKLPTIWTDESRDEKSQRKEKKEEERRSRCVKRSESCETLHFFQWFMTPEGRKVGSLKRRASWLDERCRIVRCCGVKHTWKSKCTKRTMLGSLLEVAMSKKCTWLWREVHFEVKMLKAAQVGLLLDTPMSFRVDGAGILHLLSS